MTFIILIQHRPGAASVSQLWTLADSTLALAGIVTSTEPSEGIRTLSDHAKRLADA